MTKLKITIYYIAKYLGLFLLSRKYTKHKLQILCYHGFSYDDEHEFIPQLFMTKDKFEKRMATISDLGFTVLPLGDACEKLQNDQLPENSIAITVDDGFQSNFDIAMPIFEKFQFPWMLYITSYYMEKQTQIFNLAIPYLLWKTKLTKVDFSSFGTDIKDITNQNNYDALKEFLIEYCLNLELPEQRQECVRKISGQLNIDNSIIERNKSFHLLDEKSAKKLYENGVDIQLHTHRHTIGIRSKGILYKELDDNKNSLQNITDKELIHFCYPSGDYQAEDVEWLKNYGIKTATTCEIGLNDKNTPLLELNRFLDAQNISDIEFEAELCGFSEMMRKFK